MKHKPRKVKEPNVGETLYSMMKTTVADPITGEGETTMKLHKNRFYGTLGEAKEEKKETEDKVQVFDEIETLMNNQTMIKASAIESKFKSKFIKDLLSKPVALKEIDIFQQPV